MSDDFLNRIHEMFHDPNEPQVNEDRIFQQTAINFYTVMFKRCNHFLNVPWVVIHNMLTSHEVVNYVNSLECKMCNEEFSDMERKLNQEYYLFVKYKGKL